MTHTIPIIDQVPQFNSAFELKDTLMKRGCRRCELGYQQDLNGCCVSRGTSRFKRLLVGEAPGKNEDETGRPFSGPAGRLLDDLFLEQGLSTETFYCTNIALCRPIADAGSGRQNFTPRPKQQERCRPFLEQHLKLIDPRLVVVVGGVALKALFGTEMKITRSAGIPIEQGDKVYFPIIHPASILHLSYNKPESDRLRSKIANDIKILKEVIVKHNL